MKTYIIHLHPVPYGFEINAASAEQAREIAKRRWDELDYDFDADDQANAFEIVSEI